MQSRRARNDRIIDGHRRCVGVSAVLMGAKRIACEEGKWQRDQPLTNSSQFPQRPNANPMQCGVIEQHGMRRECKGCCIEEDNDVKSGCAC